MPRWHLAQLNPPAKDVLGFPQSGPEQTHCSQKEVARPRSRGKLMVTAVLPDQLITILTHWPLSCLSPPREAAPTQASLPSQAPCVSNPSRDLLADPFVLGELKPA